MSIITIILVIALVGLVLWTVERFIPMDITVKRILEGVVIMCLIVWLLQSFGLIGAIGTARIH